MFLQEVRRIESGKASELAGDRLLFFGRERIAFGQRDEIDVNCEILHAVQKFGERELLQLRDKLLMVPSGRCIGWEEQGVRYIVPITHIDGLKIEGRTDENDSVQRHCIPILKVISEARRPRRAIAFTG